VILDLLTGRVLLGNERSFLGSCCTGVTCRGSAEELRLDLDRWSALCWLMLVVVVVAVVVGLQEYWDQRDELMLLVGMGPGDAEPNLLGTRIAEELADLEWLFIMQRQR